MTLAAVLVSTTATAQTYYYIGGDGATTNFMTAASWSNTLGGPAVASISAAGATYIIDGSDVSSAGGAQPGTSVTFSLNVNTAMTNLIVQNNNIGVTITSVNYTFNVSNDFTLGAGCTMSNQISQPFTIGGNMVNNGTLTYGSSSGEYTFTGTGKTISGSATTQFRKITIATGATIALQRNIELISTNGSVTSFINGTLDAQTYSINEAGSINMNITLAATGLLKTTNLLGVRGQAGATIDPNLTLNMSTGNTIEFSAPSGVQQIWCGNSVTYYHNIVISGGGTKRLVNGSAQWIDIRGSLTIGAGNTLDVSATGDATNIKDIEFDENFTNNGTFIARTGLVTIAGSGGTQVLTMNGSTLYNLELANPVNNAASLGSDVTLTHALTFTNGRLLLGNYNFTFDINALSPVGGTNLKMLATNGNGEVKKVVAAGGGQFTYAVGDINGVAEYSPVVLNFTSNSAVRTFGVRVVDAQHPNDNTVTSYISRYWHFSETSAPGSYTYDAAFTYLAADLVGPAAPMSASYIYLPNTTWTGITTTNTTNTMTVTGTTQSLFNAEVTGRVTAGCPPPNQPGAFTTLAATVCAGQNGVTYTVPNDPNVTYNWSYSGTGATIVGSGNSVTVNFASNATGGTLSVTATNACPATSAPRDIVITVNPAVGTPTFTAGDATLCVNGSSTYTATATNSSTIVYSILSGNANINALTGVVSNVSGNFVVRATAAGNCGNPTTADFSVTVNPLVGQVAFTQAPATICQNDGPTYIATAANSSGITYSIVAGTASIDAATGVVSNIAGSSFTVRATASGICGTPTTADQVVTVNPVQTTAFTQDICNGTSFDFNGDILTAGGVYVDTLQTALGCDSIITLTLNINGPTATINLTGGVNLSTGTFAGYQWLFNGAPINGAQSQNHVAQQNGNYQVIVTDANGCSDTSAVQVVVGVGIAEAFATFSIYPNPTTGFVFIKGDNIAAGKYIYVLTDAAGRVLSQNTIAIGGTVNERIDISHLAKGMYMLTVTGENSIAKTFTVIKAE